MNRIISFLLVFFPPYLLIAQTYYYRLEKSIIQGVENKAVSGGQFITFNGKLCYESDRNGNTVGNGHLCYAEEFSDNQMSVYWGICYYSRNAYFKFNRDKTLLNIETNAGKIYVYRRSTPPTGITTCSLIRKDEPTLADADNNRSKRSIIEASSISSPPPVFINSGGAGGATPQKTRPHRQETVKRECPLCHGEKWIVHNSYPAMYGQTDYKIRCERCGKEFMKSTGHRHIICTQCNGRGFYVVK